MSKCGEGVWGSTYQVTTPIEVLRARARAANGRPVGEDEFGNFTPRTRFPRDFSASGPFPPEEPEELHLGEEGDFDEQLADGFEMVTG